ncbi:HEAT repeat domain-containing protein [Candidatus Bipolaricaulota bacterium]|nr:HEAT repeat domain-containing protein [Candidatus Bipolaricaulota bacterium]
MVPSFILATERAECDPGLGGGERGLGRVWSNETASRLIVVLEGGSEDVRKEAVLSLGRIGGSDALAALLAALRSDPSLEVRWRAAIMIGRNGDEGIVLLLHGILVAETAPLVIEHLERAKC